MPLSASGVGTSIVVGELRDRIVLGKHFTKIPLNSKVIMENCGTRLHALEWSEHYKAPKTKQPTAYVPDSLYYSDDISKNTRRIKNIVFAEDFSAWTQKCLKFLLVKS